LYDWREDGRVNKVDEVLTHKAAIIERCVQRARELHAQDPAGFAADLTRQDAAILNVERACAAALDMGQHLIRRDGLGTPQNQRDVFALLASAGRIDETICQRLQEAVGYVHTALHDDQALQLPITVAVITTHLEDFLLYSAALLSTG
jgi:uncharacterized protein YutE (UPF0331/DUF86 family)